MKKIMIMFGVALTFAACNGATESIPAQDSTIVVVDTTVAVDTAAVVK